MNFFRKAFIVILLLAITYVSNAQSLQLQGTVKDRFNHTALSFANVSVTSLNTKQRINLQADADGRFQTTVLDQGWYAVNVSYIGYQTFRNDSLQFNSKNPVKELMIELLPDHQQLKSVTVTAARQPVIIRADKIIVNVAGSTLAAGGNALEAVSRAPGVINQGGNLQVRSKPAVIMIDGRYTNLKGDELANYLSSIPANSIDRIEVIHSPSARYDAQGAAVINIISAKNKLLGTNGTATAGTGAGRYSQFQGGVALSHNEKKTNVYGSYDYQHTQAYNRSLLNRTLGANQTINEEEFAVTTRNNNALKLGLDYNPNKRNSFGVLVKGLLNYRNREVNNMAQARTSGTVDSSSSVSTQGSSRIINPAVNLYYKLTIDTTGRVLSVNADYFGYRTRRGNNYTTNYFDRNGQLYRAPYLLRDNSPGNNTIASVTADYAGRLFKGQLEAGLKNTNTQTDNDILWEQYTGGQWLTDFGKTNHFIYKENIAAAYATYSQTFKKMEVQAGLRAEQTHTEGNSITLDQANVNTYFKLFPSVSLNYQLNAKNQVGIGYRKKIERYNFDVVNPFIVYRSQYSYFQGNPNLQPAYYHTFDASYSYNNELFVSGSYSLWRNVLADIYRQDPNSKAAISTYENLNSARSADLTISQSKNFFQSKWTTVNTFGGVYARFRSANAGLNNVTYSAYLSSDNTIQLLPGLRAQIYASYFSPIAFGVYHIQARFQTDAGLTKSLFNKAGSLTLNVTDVFNTQRNRYDVNAFGVQLNNNNKAESRFVKLVFTYRFGNQNAKGARSRRTGIESEKSRMGSN